MMPNSVIKLLGCCSLSHENLRTRCLIQYGLWSWIRLQQPSSLITLLGHYRIMETHTPLAVTDWIRLIAVVGAFAAMLIGLALVFSRLKAKQQGFGPGSLRALVAIVAFRGPGR